MGTDENYEINFGIKITPMRGKRRASACNTSPSNEHMILHFKITLNKLSKSGKKYKWPKHYCECCKRYMWGHGYVSRYFAAILNEVFLKRYRCPDCSVVVTTRPEGYWARARSSIFSIYEALKAKLNFGSWPLQFPRQRGGHWIRRFVSLAKMELQDNLVHFLDHCYLKQIQFLP